MFFFGSKFPGEKPPGESFIGLGKTFSENPCYFMRFIEVGTPIYLHKLFEIYDKCRKIYHA